MKHAGALAGLLLTTLAAGLPAFGDGGFFFEQTATVALAQTRQEVLLAFYSTADGGEARTTYVIRTRYAGQPGAFAWVVPVPATPTEVTAQPSGSLFDALGALTEPTFSISGFSGRGGCGCAAGAAAPAELGLVEVEASGQAGIFEWTALTSTGTTALLTWLNDHGFAVPSAAATVLEPYIQSERHFLAVRVSKPEDVAADSSGVIELPPIQFTCATTERFYPLAISQISAAPQTEVLAYVLADHRAEGANVSNAVIDPQAVIYDPNSASQTNYETLFSQIIAPLGGLVLVTEFAGTMAASSPTTQPASQPSAVLALDLASLPPEVRALDFLTRMRTVIDREQMTRDLLFQDAPNDEPVSRYFSVSVSSSQASLGTAGSGLATVVAYGLLYVGMKRRTRSSRGRVSR
jgi:hypothetical protein